MAELSKHRFEAFSDGVMAIIITIIVLQIPLTNDFSFNGIISLLYFIFIFFVSFFIVGYFWNKHHAIFDNVNKITNKIIWRNMIFLFFLALLPILTKWVLENPTEIVPVIAYDILFILLNLSYFIVVKEVFHGKKPEELDEMNEKIENNHPHAQDREGAQTRIIFMVLIIAILIGLAIFYPQITIIFFMGFPLIFALISMFFEDREEIDNKKLENHEQMKNKD